ncbi:MAG: hypothetical protein ACRC20_07140 [Segniliparus sp.]|uniref:hypothetical protein n=1 Tax=Segniliparus sp. TaxID=2804064 RepID=UPI003F3644CB
MKRVTSLSLSAIGLLAALPVSFAHADENGDYWGGIGFTSDGTYQPFHDGAYETDIILAIQKSLGSNAHHVQFSSGRCGALIGYDDGSGRTRYYANTGSSRDGAMRNARNGVYHESYHIVLVKCQD